MRTLAAWLTRSGSGRARRLHERAAKVTATSWYERRVLPRLLDVACGLPPITRCRHAVVPAASGHVLEVGIGTGLNLRHYDRERVASITGVDPAPAMHSLARLRAARLELAVELSTLNAQSLPHADASFDCVVCTYTLCSVDEPRQALREMRRVLKPGGRLLFAEHGLAPDADVARWQARLEPRWRRIAGGCHLTRDVPALLSEAGFSATTLRRGYVVRWPRSLAYNYWREAAA